MPSIMRALLEFLQPEISIEISVRRELIVIDFCMLLIFLYHICV
jgi:hypothetical protein